LKLRLPWRRRAAAAEAEAAPLFDASIDIDREEAVDAVREGVRALPGAGWISVEAHAGAAASVRLFAAGSSVRAEGDGWAALFQAVGRAVERALRETPHPAQGWSAAPVLQAGFAEASAPSPMHALEQLAALAQTTRLPVAAPPPPSPIDLDDGQRLARLLGLVLPADAQVPAAAAIRRFGSYAGVLAAPEAELRLVPGLGVHSIAAIKLIHATAVRLARAAVAAQPVLDDRTRLHDYLAAALGRERIEQFRILFLDELGMLRADEIQASGTVNHTPVYPREVVRRALALGAASLVLVHNHPSGDPAPSREDIDMTRQVREAAAVMQIGLRDHVIVGNGRWLSFRDAGLLD
jgi:DNA repair protein RadC